MNRRFIPSLESLEGRQLLATVAAAFAEHGHVPPAEVAPPVAGLPTVSIQIEQQPTCDVVVCTIGGGVPHRVEVLGGEGEWTDLTGTVRLTVPSDTRAIVLQATTAEGEALPLLLVEVDPLGRVVSQSWSLSPSAISPLSMLPGPSGLHGEHEMGSAFGDDASSGSHGLHTSPRGVDVALTDHTDSHGGLSQANVVAAHAELHLLALRMGRHAVGPTLMPSFGADQPGGTERATDHAPSASEPAQQGEASRTRESPEASEDYDAILSGWGAQQESSPAADLLVASLKPIVARVPTLPQTESPSAELPVLPTPTRVAADAESVEEDAAVDEDPSWLAYAGAFAVSIGCLGGVVYVEVGRNKHRAVPALGKV